MVSKHKDLHQEQCVTPFSSKAKGGKYHTEPEAAHRASDAGNKESPSCGVSGGEEEEVFYGKKYLPSEKTGEKTLRERVYMCVWVHKRHECYNSDFLQTCVREKHFGDPCIPDIPSCGFPVRVSLTVPQL